MALSSLFRKKSPASQPNEGEFQSRAEGESADLRQAAPRAKRKSARQTNEPVDPMLPEKKRARRRLVGAVALVLAAIIGLPMILDAEQKPLNDDVVIQIPSKDQVAPASRSSRMAASAGLDPAEEVVNASSMPAKTDLSVMLPTETKTADGKPKAAVAVDGAKPKSTNKSDIKTAAKADHSTTPSNGGKAVVANTAETDSARAEAILNGDGDPVKAEKKNTKMIVQIAALASKEKVSELQDKLKAAGIPSFTQTVATDSGPRIRVRIGPFASKEAAETARSKLSKLGLNGTLVPS